ncbi:uncharacterized mitochondrial protein AtMg00810-like [Arachis hypogaea]|uniref:uncharacterized mitochondrial protein AtMg00810-like n=2 Tax=Arachis TaxID=3817 RepID=UPI000DED8B07|nr:uncharacterized protein LOC112786263 [Arachis hypogaea]
MTQPDITYAVNKVAIYAFTLCSALEGRQTDMHYLAGTSKMGLQIHKNYEFRIIAFNDLDWAADLDDPRSTIGYYVFLGTNLLCWLSRKQAAVSRSSSKAEFRALVDVMADTIWLQKLLNKMHLSLGPAPTTTRKALNTVRFTVGRYR